MTTTFITRCCLLLYLYLDVTYTRIRAYREPPNLCNQRNLPRICDYIVVGAGAAGATIASRLSEDPYMTVCLLEAGIKDTDNPVSSIIETPRLWPLLMSGPVTWNHTTIPQKGMNGREISVGMGKTLGGSTSHNALNYFRGLKTDFDFWEASGAVGWGYNDVLPFFKKLENNVPSSSSDSSRDNIEGPFTISQSEVSEETSLFKLLTRTAIEAGIPRVGCGDISPTDDKTRSERRMLTTLKLKFILLSAWNSDCWMKNTVADVLSTSGGIDPVHGKLTAGYRIPSLMGIHQQWQVLVILDAIQHDQTNPEKQFISPGFCKSRKSIKSGRRESTSTAYLQPVVGRRNLYVVTEALVRKILITRYNKRAYGIRYSKNGRIQSLKARYEIIISAGAISSPQLLQLSGIGPRELLRRHKIKVIVDLPVGRNFHDHVLFISADILVDVPIVRKDLLNDPNALSEYVLRQSGPLSDESTLLALSFNTSTRRRRGSLDIVNYFQDGIIPRPDDNNKRNGTSVVIALLQPKGRGTISIRSRNPEAVPLIDPNYFRVEDDIRLMIAAIRTLQRFIEFPSMREMNASFGAYTIPNNCRSEKTDSDRQWRCILKSLAVSGHHPVSTCKMGSRYDRTTVLDPQLRVKGINGLRVADASIMPRVTSSATMGTSIMIGEKAADMIRRHYINRRCKVNCLQTAKYSSCG